ncbi:transposase [Streptomyces sp. NPDC001852]|uniref:transposase n=1 Tax=Streptomyces sp. NPDC001852 TaxID=3364619 RepID=UPI00367C1C86
MQATVVVGHQCWTDDRERCQAAKAPDERVFATKGELAKRLVLRAVASALSLAWVTADAAYGQEGRFVSGGPVPAGPLRVRRHPAEAARGPRSPPGLLQLSDSKRGSPETLTI